MTRAKSQQNNTSEELSKEWFSGDALTLAPLLLGKKIRKGSCTGIIVETEAYGTDPASHAYKITKRSASMRDTYGYWYVYFTYGMYHCANITTNKNGVGAVLIRAVEPIKGMGLMRRRRARPGAAMKPDMPTQNLCSGPAKFCQAFGITKKENITPVGDNFVIYNAPKLTSAEIGVSSRIGIKKGTELPWRFYIKENAFVSKKH